MALTQSSVIATLSGQKDEEILFDQSFDAPSYMRAADIYDRANRNTGRMTADTSILEDVPKFIASSLISGGAQLYNILPSVGNLLGGDFDLAEIDSVFQAIDDDLGKFYEQHRGAVDTVGFILSSLVPGMAGIKGIRALQSAGVIRLEAAMKSGRIGETTGKALGLLSPNRERALNAAITEITNSNSTFTFLNRNFLRSMGAGLGQNIIEAAAFEVAVAATLYNSPILEGQDIGNFTSNIIYGGLAFGAIGGVVDATRGVFKVRRSVKAADAEAFAYTHYKEPLTGTPAEDKLAIYWDQVNNEIPIAPTTLTIERQSFLNSAADKKKTKLLERVRENLTVLAAGDQEAAQQMFTILKLGNKQDGIQNIFGLTNISKVSESTRPATKLAAALKRQRAGKSRLVGKDGAPGDEEIIQNTRVAYVKLFGEGMGELTDVSPLRIGIGDSLKKGDKVVVDPSSGVKIERTTKNTLGNRQTSVVENFPFTHDPIKPWSIISASTKEASARYAWAQELPSLKSLFKKQNGIPTIRESDIPLLEKLHREFTPNHIIKMDDATQRAFASSDEFFEFIVKQKEKWVNKLNNKTNKGVFLGNEQDVITKLRHITGINFRPGKLPSDSFGQRVVDKKTGATRIILNQDDLLKRPLHELIGTLKHEEGHQIFDTLIDIGGLPLDKAKAILAEAAKVSAKRPGRSPKGQDEARKKYLAQEHELMADTFTYFSQFPDKLLKEAPTFAGEFGHLLRPLPKTVIDKYFARAEKLTQEEIASMVNVRSSYLSGQMSNTASRDIFAMQSFAEEYTEDLVKRGLRKESEGLVKTWKQSQHLKLTYDTTPVQGLDGNIIRGMAVIKEKQRFAEQNANYAFVQVIGKDAEKYTEISDRLVQGANSLGSGPTLAGAANSNPGSLGSVVEYLGQITTGVIKKFKDETSKALEPALYKLAQNKKAYIEWSTLNANLRAIEDHYVLNKAGDALIPKVVDDFEEAVAAGKKPDSLVLRDPNSPLRIDLATDEVRELAKIHIARNGKRIESSQILHASQGAPLSLNPKEFYPVPVNIQDFPFFAHVKDTSVTGIGRTKTIYANSGDELDQITAKLKGEPTLIVTTKGEMEQYLKSIGEFDAELTLSDNFLDSTLSRRGISSPYIISTDPTKITSELLGWHLSAEASLVRGAVKVKYDKQISELHAMGESYTNIATSRYNNSSLLKYSDTVVKNPYAGYERTMLGIRNSADYPWWTNANRQIDAVFSQMYSRITGVLESSKSLDELTEINTILAASGYKGARYTPEMDILANHTAASGELSKLVTTGNGILAAVVLRLDTLNALNNTMGHGVLFGTESLSIIRAIKRSDSNAINDLSKLMDVKVPGTDDFIFSPAKLFSRGVKAFGSSDKTKMAFFKEHGWITTISQQYKQTLDDLVLRSDDTVKTYGGRLESVRARIRKAVDTGEKWTGNRLAEEFNRFVAAHAMKDITDVAVKYGVIAEKEALPYINTFVNRTQGNYLAAQRPVMFQGPVGQAIGLFQTYQFNLMQQLLRHVGEGQTKDSMTLLGLQGTIYGMNGLPGFNAINTNIIGNASGNKQHRDFYDVTYGIAGKEAGDWLTYGLASNMLLDPDLKINLYVRGDINPRHVTLVPTDPASVPIVQATGKFFKNLKNTAQKLQAGGDVWQTLLQGIEHNGISRPLAGLAQTLQGLDGGKSFSTSKRGNVIAANDLLSLANLARMVGGKPLDEAIAIDAAFRFKSYALEDSFRRNKLGQAVKSTLIAGGKPTAEQVENFTQRYAELGGSQTEYNKWVMQLYKTANTSQANKLSQDLGSPFNKSMQKIMGGYELSDFSR